MSRQTRYRPNQSWTNPRPANLTIDRRLELAIGVSNSTRRPRDSSSNFCRRLERVVLKCGVLRAAVDRWGRVCRGTEINSGFVGSTLAGWFDNDQRLIEEARRLRRVSGYVTINPVRSDLLARSDNRLSRSRHATRDDDILCLRWLYLDIDPIRPADISSTDVELLTAIKRRDAILGDHPELAACGAWGCSGNGAWILVRLADYPNDAHHAALLVEALATLDRQYSDNIVRIDTATANPARLIGLPGTLKVKGSDRPDRPWRRVTLDGFGTQRLERSR